MRHSPSRRLGTLARPCPRWHRGSAAEALFPPISSLRLLHLLPRVPSRAVFVPSSLCSFRHSPNPYTIPLIPRRHAAFATSPSASITLSSLYLPNLPRLAARSTTSTAAYQSMLQTSAASSHLPAAGVKRQATDDCHALLRTAEASAAVRHCLAPSASVARPAILPYLSPHQRQLQGLSMQLGTRHSRVRA